MAVEQKMRYNASTVVMDMKPQSRSTDKQFAALGELHLMSALLLVFPVIFSCIGPYCQLSLNCSVVAWSESRGKQVAQLILPWLNWSYVILAGYMAVNFNRVVSGRGGHLSLRIMVTQYAKYDLLYTFRMFTVTSFVAAIALMFMFEEALFTSNVFQYATEHAGSSWSVTFACTGVWMFRGVFFVHFVSVWVNLICFKVPQEKPLGLFEFGRPCSVEILAHV